MTLNGTRNYSLEAPLSNGGVSFMGHQNLLLLLVFNYLDYCMLQVSQVVNHRFNTQLFVGNCCSVRQSMSVFLSASVSVYPCVSEPLRHCFALTLCSEQLRPRPKSEREGGSAQNLVKYEHLRNLRGPILILHDCFREKVGRCGGGTTSFGP